MVIVHKYLKNPDSCMFYANKTLEVARTTKQDGSLLVAYQALSIANQVNNEIDSAFKYEQLAYKLNDSLKNIRIDNLTKYQKSSFDEQLRLKKLDEERTAYANNLKLLGLLSLLGGILVVAFILYRNNLQKQKANSVLQDQKDKVETTLHELKATQSQLIQSEKMASLGELTAGIAHEIQNPLNFVNNFSEVSNELIKEMKEEFKKGDVEEGFAIANDIEQNLEKINHHGKRAADIVKGMLQHSRSSNGVKEPTDINALADEYLRLAYHGLRAKDKSFNATMKTDFDETIGNINIIPQDIGRVILNLITNAFYAASLPSKGGFKDPNYKHEPTIWVKTSKNPTLGGRGAEVLISVRDNGPGIPRKILDKIFQPFFTTKPTGQGTGLGLSLSYDIVKAHGGELKVETKEGEGTVFIIQIPIV
jgi:two-component system NtrC family sensor kinase